MKLLLCLFVILFGIWVAFLGFFNYQIINFDYVFGEISWPLFLIVLFSFVIGAFFATLLFGTKAFFLKNSLKSLQKEIKANQKAQQDELVKQQFIKERANG